MRAKNVSLTMTGDWQTVNLGMYVIGLQLRNARDNDTVQFRWFDGDEELEIAAGENLEAISPKPLDEPLDVSNLMVKGSVGDILVGEAWLYNHQDIT